jgi:hypothetical protein
MTAGGGKRGGLGLVEVIRYVITTLVHMAQTKAWGEIRITVQSGQIEFVHESRSHRDRLPAGDQAADQVLKELVAAS